MISRKHLIIGIFSTFCLTTVLFMTKPVGSQSELVYDPWKDLNDDGKIDLLDIVTLASIYGMRGAPINKTELLLRLQSKITSLEEMTSQTKWIRFYDPRESLSYAVDIKDIVTFVWIPNNKTNNAVLSIRCFFQHYTNGTHTTPATFKLIIDGRETDPASTFDQPTEFEWSRVFYDYDLSNPWAEPQWTCFVPNRANHTITFQLYAANPWITVHVKDINILLEVMDGLPPS